MREWKKEMSAIQSDIRRERSVMITRLPEIQPLGDAEIEKRKKTQENIINRYENEVVPRMKKESLTIFILHVIYYLVLTTFSVLSFLNVVELTAILGTLGLTAVGAGIDLPAIYNRIKQTIVHRPILDKSVTFLKDKLDQVNTIEEINDLEETMDVISTKALYNYNEFIEVIIKLKETYPLKH